MSSDSSQTKVKISRKGVKRSEALPSEISIDFNREIKEFSTVFATACHAKMPGHSGQSYALLLHPIAPIRMQFIEAASGDAPLSIQRVLAHGRVVAIGGKEYYAVVLDYPQHPTLSQYIHDHGALDDREQVHPIIEQLYNALRFCNAYGLTHGSINPGNIFFDAEKNTVVLKCPLDGPCGFSQDPVFEALDQLQAHPAGKGDFCPERDYFSLGATVLYLLSGSVTYASNDAKAVMVQRMMEGSSEEPIRRQIVSKSVLVTRRTEMLLRGLMTDNANLRWTLEELNLWLKRVDVNVPASKVHRNATNPLHIEDREFYGMKHVAHDLFSRWSESVDTVRVDDLVRWLSLSVRRQDIADEIKPLQKMKQEQGITEQNLTRIVHTLDPTGPVRFRSFAAYPHGFGAMLAYAYLNDEQEIINAMVSMFKDGLYEHWLRVQEDPTLYDFTSLGWSSQKIRKNIKLTGYGFGMERSLYDFSSYMPSLGTRTDGKFIISLEDALNALEHYKSDREEVDPLDRFLAAFIANRVGLLETITIKSLANYTKISKFPAIQMLALLTVAQNEAAMPKLSGLSAWVADSILPLIENLKSRYIRSEISKKINKARDKGDLNEIFSVMSSPLYAKRDTYGFEEAQLQYVALADKIRILSDPLLLQRKAYKYGLRISVMLSYLILAVTLIFVVYHILS